MATVDHESRAASQRAADRRARARARARERAAVRAAHREAAQAAPSAPAAEASLRRVSAAAPRASGGDDGVDTTLLAASLGLCALALAGAGVVSRVRREAGVA